MMGDFRHGVAQGTKLMEKLKMTRDPSEAVVRTTPSTDRKQNALEIVLEANQLILRRIVQIQNRLEELNERLHGSHPVTDEHGGSENPEEAGMMGRLQTNSCEMAQRCEAIENWLGAIERAI